MVDISEYAKASPINGRGSIIQPVPRENAVIDDREGIWKVLPWELFSDLIELDRITSQNWLIQNGYSTEPRGDKQQAR